MIFSNIFIDLYNIIIGEVNSNRNNIEILANILAIFSVLFPALFFLFTKFVYLYRLKTFENTKRPKWLTEEEFSQYIHNYVKTKVIFYDNKKRISIDKFIKHVIIKGKKQYHIVLGESGSGKSTFLVNLYYRFNCKLFRHNYKIEYIPLKKSENLLEYIEKIIDQERTILLLDAFDESFDANQDANTFLNIIEEKTQYFAKIIITSRNNFFDADDLVPNVLRINRVLNLNKEKFERYFIAPFSFFDVVNYITQKYKWHLTKQIKAYKIIKQCQEIMCRPVVLSYMDFLIHNKKLYTNIFYIYESIVDNWIKRESLFIWKLKANKDDTIEDVVKKLKCLVNDITLYMYNHYPDQGDYYISISELNKFQNFKYLKKYYGKRERSLFDRISDKLFFAHKSIFEFMLSINFDRINFRFDSDLTLFYKFLKESDKIYGSVKYSGMFQVNFIQTHCFISLKPNGEMLVTSKNIDFIDMNDILDMITWHYRSFEFPVYVDNQIYNRILVEFLVNDKHVFAVNTKVKLDPLTVHYKMRKEIYKCINKRKKYEISIITTLTLRESQSL